MESTLAPFRAGRRARRQPGVELIISGCQAGDEGKGRFTDVYADQVWAVVRYQGGPHTGHSVTVGKKRYHFVQVPSGFARGRYSIIGNGCVVDPIALLAELDSLKEQGLDAPLAISEIAHVIFPYHRAQDRALEMLRGESVAVSAATGLETGQGRIGSTCKGVGPCREDKIARLGLRLIDLLDARLLRARLELLLPYKQALVNLLLGTAAGKELDAVDWDLEALVSAYSAAGERLRPYLRDVSGLLNEARSHGKNILYEGAQSFGLDIEQGTYPYCSSGHSAASGVYVGTGSPVNTQFKVFGVIKCYMSQVGGGPLPTEVNGAVADHIVQRGQEFGVVTGRRRRVGWLDLPFIRRAVRGDGPTHLCVSCLDVLAGLETVQIATHYDLAGGRTDELPRTMREIATASPVYVTMHGWEDVDWSSVARRGMAGLSENAAAYLRFLSQALDVPIAAVGVGPARENTIVDYSPF